MLMLLTRRFEAVEETYWKGLQQGWGGEGKLDNATRGFPRHEASITHDPGVPAFDPLDELTT